MRRAGAADVASVVLLCDEALAEVSSQRGGPQLVWQVLGGRTVPEAVDDAVGDPSTMVVLASIDGTDLGVGIVEAHAPGPATVAALFVDPGARCVGLGEMMLDTVAPWAEGRGCAGLDAAALPGSRATKAFFETYGMVTRALVMHRPVGSTSDDATGRR